MVALNLYTLWQWAASAGVGTRRTKTLSQVEKGPSGRGGLPLVHYHLASSFYWSKMLGLDNGGQDDSWASESRLCR